MADDAFNDSEETRGECDPHEKTAGDETADKGWLHSNVHARGDEWIGQSIGQFEIVRIIGTGGMGNVYEALQSHPHRSVALKIVKSAAASPITLQRFEMESDMLARLQHPGIAQVFDSGHQIHEGTPLPYFAMEYVPGSRHITDYAEDEHLSIEGKLTLFLFVCEAVLYGHGRGVIHRDLKPSNILITNAGRPKVIDFGVAKLAGEGDSDHTKTKHGRFVGTLQWSSPEQCGEDPHDVDVRSDVYSLGMILYQLMTGQLPYELKGTPIYKAPTVVLESIPTPPRSLNASLPIEIEHILGKSLEKDRASRYDSVAELSLDIRRYLTNQPIHAKPPSKMHRLRLYAKRNQLKFRAVIVVSIAILLGIAGLVWGFIESEARQNEMKELLQKEAVARVDAEYKAYVATIGTVQAAVANNAWDMARNNLTATARQQRGWEWYYLQGVVDQSLSQWLIGDRPIALATSNDGKHLVVTFEGGRVLLIDDKRNILKNLQMQTNIKALEFSADGNSLFFALEDGVIGLLDLEYDALEYINTNARSISSIETFSSGGYATGHENGVVKIWDEEHKSQTQWDSGHGMVLSLAFDNTRNRLAIGSTDGTVQIMYLGENKLPTILGAHGGAVFAIEISSDGKVFSAGADDSIRVWDVQQMSLLQTLKGHVGDVMDIAISGNVLTSAGEDGNIHLWSIDNLEHLEMLKGHDDLIWSIGPLGKDRIITVGRDGSIRWWNSTLTSPSMLKVASSMPASDLAFVWNETLVAVSEFDHGIQVINVMTGDSKNVLSDSTNKISKVAFVPTTSNVVTGDINGDISLWNAEQFKHSNDIGTCEGHISSLSVSPFGRHVAAGSFDGKLSVWEIANKRLIFETTFQSYIVLATAFGEGGDELFVSTSDGSLFAFDLNTKQIKWKSMGNNYDVVVIHYIDSLDAIITATAIDGIQLRNALNGELITERDMKGGSLRDLVVFPDEKRFATVLGDGTISVWSINHFSLAASFPSTQSLETITVSTDGHRLAVGGGNATIQLMDSMSKNARETNAGK